jgi:hypothetical protein
MGAGAETIHHDLGQAAAADTTLGPAEADEALRRAVEAHQELRAAERAFEALRDRFHVERARAIRDARAAGLTLAGIAGHLNVSTERVRQMATVRNEDSA